MRIFGWTLAVLLAGPLGAQPFPEPVVVTGGTFWMGTTEGGYPDERPAHQVTVSTFRMSATEVTRAQWVAVLGERFVPAEDKAPDKPVDLAGWSDAIEFCNALSRTQGLTPAYRREGGEVVWDRSSTGWRLPTEAEWEYAARGGARSAGTRYPGSDNPDEVAWYGSNSGTGVHPVATKKPNELGLYDLAGNAWEWCWDWYAPYGPGSEVDPAGPEKGSVQAAQGAATTSGPIRQIRGGSWTMDAPALRPNSRFYSADFRAYNAGFRVVRSGA